MIRCSLLVVLLASAVSCVQYGSLSFVIDDTKSMEEDISKVREAVDGIMDIILNQPTSQIEDVVLVTFNDPIWLTKRYPTKTREELKHSLNSIRVHGGGDCPEYSMTGILLALENSLQNSYLFVFTDAPPKDTHLIAKVKRVAQSRGTQIIFVRTPGIDHCRTSIPDSDFKPYYDIAASTFGQVFSCGSKKEVEDILRYVKVVISGGGHVGKRIEIPPFKLTEIPFYVDDQTEYVVVSASGIDVSLKLIGGPTKTFEKITWIHNAKVIKIDNPAPGDYKVEVVGNATTSVLIFGRTDFTFQYGFSNSQQVPPSIDHGDVRKQPREGKPHRLLVNVTDEHNTVDIKTAEILTSDDQRVIKTMPLTRISKNFYATDPFVAPNRPFLIAIKGIGKKTRKELRRIAKTPIESVPDDSSPFLTVTGPSEVEYEGTVKLTCHVEGYPKPKIIWKSYNGADLTHLSRTRDIDRSHFTSELTLTKLTESGRYSCQASNRYSSYTDSIYVKTKLPFIVDHQNTITKRIIEYGPPFTIRCNITSKYPMKIVWYYKLHNKYTEIASSGKYSIVKEGIELRVNKGTQDEEGEYKCQATLNQDKSKNIELVTTINTNGKPPTFGPMDENITIRENRDLVLKCPVRGHPPPKITWLFKFDSSNGPNDLNQHKDTVVIKKINIANAGKYICIVSNALGHESKTISVNVQILPKVTLTTNNVQTSSTTVDYGSKILMVCKVTSHTKPNVVWKNAQDEVIALPEIQKRDTFEFIAQLTIPKLTKENTYKCEASNEIGKTTKQVYVQPKNPFKIENKQDTVTFDYGKSGIILCPIKSDFATIITWYRQRDPKSTNREVITNTEKYTILKDGTELRISKVEEGIEGKYVCEATVKDDKSTSLQHVVDVSINHAAPVIDKPREDLYVKEHQSIVLKCNVIHSYPKAKITWQFKKIGDVIVQTLPETSETLRIANAELTNFGYYYCTAQNDKGKMNKEILLTVQIPPRVTLKIDHKEVTTTKVDYKNTLEIYCLVQSHVMPTIIWRNKNGNIINTFKTDTLNKLEFISLIRIADIKKNDIYTCEAINDVSKKVKSVSVEVNDPFPDAISDNTINIKYGEPATIKCGVRSQFPIKLSWTFMDKNNKIHTIDNSDKYSISVDGADLTIKKMDDKLDGLYKCTAVLKDDESVQKIHNTKVKLELEPPQIEVGKDTVHVRANTDTILRCTTLRGNPRPKLAWTVEGENRNSKLLIEYAGDKAELTLRNVRYEDSKKYKCVASSISGQMVKTVQVIVTGPPIITSDDDKVYYGVQGDHSLQVPCEVKGYPSPIIKWTKDKTPITSGGKYIIKDGMLIIMKPKEDDTANYTCTAENRFGTADKSFEVSVSRNIEDDNFGNVTYVYMLKGETKDFKCSSKHSIGRWYQETWLTNITGTLTLKDVTFYNDGNYTCRISDETESKSHTYVIDVGFPPRFIRGQNKDSITEYWQGENKNLDCDVEMKPKHRTVKIEWTVNGKISANNGYLHPVAGWGSYTCKVSNVHGEVSKTFYITSKSCVFERSLLSKPTAPLVTDISGNWPELTAKTSYISIKSGSKLILSCQNQNEGPNAFKKIPGKDTVTAICNKEDNFVVDGVTHKFSEIECNKGVNPTIKQTGEQCSPIKNTELIKVGFNDNNFLEVYEVCFNKETKTPLYSKATIRRPTNYNYNSSTTWKKIDAFNNGIHEDINIDQCSLQTNQMVNKLDVREGPAQLATYIAGLNTISIWSCNRKVPWSKVEEETRSFLRRSRKLDTWTGAENYIQRDNNISYPKYLWKILKFSKYSMVAVVFVNDPSPKQEDILCKSSCEDYGLSISGDPYTYCCSTEEFKKHFYMPDVSK